MINDVLMVGFEQIANMFVICSLFESFDRGKYIPKAILIFIEMAMILLIQTYSLSGWWMLLAYAIMIVGICLIFQKTLLESLLAFLFGFVLVGVGELILYIPFAVFKSQMYVNDFAGVVGSGGTVILAFVFRKQLYGLNIAIDYIKKKQQAICFVGTIIFLCMFFAALYFRQHDYISIYGFAFLLFFFIVMVPFFIQHAVMQREVEEKSKYEKPILDVIDRIRLQQHQFDSHLNAIYGLINAASDCETLKKELEQYMDCASKPDPCYRLLFIADPVLAGFLSVKISEAQTHHIDVRTEVAVSEICSNIPDFEFVGLLGNLIDNAFEAVEECEVRQKIVVIEMSEWKDFYTIFIRNPYRKLSKVEINQFFKRGVSSKAGKFRGYGLPSVLNTINRYGGKVIANSVWKENAWWFVVQLRVKRLP